MTYGAFTQDFASYDCVVRSRTPLPHVALCALALVSTTGVGLWALQARQTASTPQVAFNTAEIAAPAQIASKAAIALRRPAAAPKSMVAELNAPPRQSRGLLDPELTSSYGAVVFARSVPLRSGGELRRQAAPMIAEAAAAVPVQPAPPPSKPSIVPPAQVVAALSPIEEPATTVPQVVPAEPANVSPVVVEEDVPLPLPRPASLNAKSAVPTMPATRHANVQTAEAQTADVGAVPAAPAHSGFFDKLFGKPRESGQVLAYAAPEDGLIGNVFGRTTGAPAATDRYTAVYNITTHTVTLPDGTRLEAHSGLGAAKDNPQSVTQHMVGATPPNVYELSQREASFHGVRALRLTPTGGTTYGRAGLLAHTYMLRGHSGESNGCVVFRDYAAFLRAYDSGAVRRLAVVAGG